MWKVSMGIGPATGIGPDEAAVNRVGVALNHDPVSRETIDHQAPDGAASAAGSEG